MSRVCLTANNGFVIYNFRKELIKRLILEGFDVYCIFSGESYKNELEELGCSVEIIDTNFNSYNIFNDLSLIRKYYLLFKKISPKYVLSFTIKPNIYSTIAAKRLGIKSICNITGIGRTFDSFTTRFIVSFLYKFAFRNVYHVLFQNKDDMKLFKDMKLIKTKNDYSIINGSGVDLTVFKTSNMEGSSNKVKFLFVGRVLKEKGYHLLIEASKELYEKYPDRFSIDSIGKVPKDTNISDEQLSSSYVTYKGTVSNVSSFMDDYDVIVLPSLYREGVPRSLIEGTALSKIIITTDNVGCRETVMNGQNGYMIKKDSVQELSSALEKVLLLSSKEKNDMKKRSRKLAEERFDVEIIIDKYLSLIQG